MADYRAIKGVTEAVIYLLRSGYRPEDFNNELEFKIFTSKDFAKPISNGASLFLYRIYPNGAHRTPAGRIDRYGQRVQTQLPVELHFLLTIWGKEYSLQHTLAGWVMRTLEDNPILPAGLLNAAEPGIFRNDETVEICLAELRTEDLLRIWDVLGLNLYQLSIPYVARIIHIESQERPIADDSVLVQERKVNSAVYEPFGNI
jgi:hypothetical protein